MTKLHARGAINDNWEETQRLYEKLKGTGRCAETVFGDWDEDHDVEAPTLIKLAKTEQKRASLRSR